MEYTRVTCFTRWNFRLQVITHFLEEFKLKIFKESFRFLRKLIHPFLASNEKIIDEYIENAKSYSLQNSSVLFKFVLMAISKFLFRFMDDGQVYMRCVFKRNFEDIVNRPKVSQVKAQTLINDKQKFNSKQNAVRIVEQAVEDTFEKNKS